MFIKIGTKTAVVLVLASAVMVWVLIAPASAQTAVHGVLEGAVGVLDTLKTAIEGLL